MKIINLTLSIIIFCSYDLRSQDSTSLSSFKVLKTEQDRINMILSLGKLHSDDQNIRRKTLNTREKMGENSEAYKEAVKEWRIIDSINLNKLTHLIDTFGFDTLLKYGEDAVFFVIQHANISVQKKYLANMKSAAKNGYLEYSKFAMFEDRVLLAFDMKQIYGTQIIRDPKTGKYYVRPLEEPELLVLRRATAGLPPMSEYLKYYNTKWNVEEYKKMLPEIEKLERALNPKQ